MHRILHRKKTSASDGKFAPSKPVSQPKRPATKVNNNPPANPMNMINANNTINTKGTDG